MLLQISANNWALERQLRAARNSRGGSLDHAMLKTLISGFGSGQEFKSFSQVQSQMRFPLPVKSLSIS
jgi:hypothetical protein